MVSSIHTCPTCGDFYSGKVCVDCFTQADKSNQESFVKEYLKDVKHKIVGTFGRTKGKKSSVDIIDDLPEVDKDLDYIKQIKKDMYENMVNPNPYRLSPTADLRPDSRFRKREEREQEKRQEQEKQKMKLYKVTVRVVGKSLERPPPFKGYHTFILDSNAVDAETRVVQLLGPERVDMNYPPQVEEVKGPFSKGQVLFWDEF